jgi:hypothetical protein
MRYRFPSLPVPRLAGRNVCICNGQRSSEISCDMFRTKQTFVCENHQYGFNLSLFLRIFLTFFLLPLSFTVKITEVVEICCSHGSRDAVWSCRWLPKCNPKHRRGYVLPKR